MFSAKGKKDPPEWPTHLYDVCICIFALHRPGSEKILLLSLTALPIAVLVHEAALVEVSVEVAGGAAVEPPAGPVLGATITVFVLVVIPVLCRKRNTLNLIKLS